MTTDFDRVEPSSGESEVGQFQASPSDISARRRRMLRLVVGGVPLMTALPASAGPLAASSAWRAARHDALASPPMFSGRQDGWIRIPVSIVTMGVTAPTGGASSGTLVAGGQSTPGAMAPTTTFQAYKVVNARGLRYFRTTNLAPVDTSAGFQELRTDGQAYALVLFDSDARILGVDPTRTAGAGGIQGLHCSSWRSIAGGSFPGCRSGYGV